jgi:hypothetical protein
MRSFRIYCSLVLGVGFTLFIVLTMRVTWMFGLVLLLPGVLANWLPFASRFPDSRWVVFPADALFYSVQAAIPVWLITAKTRPDIRGMVRAAGTLTSIVAAFVVIGWWGAKTLDARGYGPCENNVREEVASPNAKLKAVIFYRDCGATTASALEISIIPTGREVNHADVGNVFTADGNHGASSLSYVFVDWMSDNAVVITYPRRARVFSQEKRLGDVNISYVPK